jgi:RNA polymerase sigma-70 factor (ECF subfamily)
VAALTRRFGVQRFALIENAVQDAYLRALEHWPREGTPDDPGKWLVRVAHNALVDALRHDLRSDELDEAYDVAHDPPAFDAQDELRLMFLCCDPVLPRAAQVALVPSAVFGLSARQIAAAFLSDERSIAQRIVRAKQRLRDAGVRFDVPDAGELRPRLAAVLDVLYLVFSEGYNPTGDAESEDASLCSEALRLARMLTRAPRTATPAAYALRALLCFHASRARARIADDGSLLLLPEQDRTKWDRALGDEAFSCLEQAGRGEELTRFHVEAGIAACHAVAPAYTATDWPRIVALYDLLRTEAPSLVVDVNRALAVGMRDGARAGLDELDAIPEREVLARYPYALAAYADLHASLGEAAVATRYLERALEHQAWPAQRALLERKRAALAGA